MSDTCGDNRFELIEKYKRKLLDATNIGDSPEEMAVIDNILFRFWQMGWLDSIDRMLLVKESAKTLMHSVGNSVSAKAFRNAGRFIQNAIDGEAPEFEKIPSAQPAEADVQKMQALEQAEIQKAYELGKLDAMEEMPHWIPCSERKPDLDEDGFSKNMLVSFSNFSGLEICQYRETDEEHGWYVGDSTEKPEDIGVHVIAWMPLPTPYREGGQETDGEA